MKAKFALVLAVSLVVLSLFAGVPFSLAQDASTSFQLQNPADGMFSYKLNVVVPQTLNDYYAGLSHKSTRDSDFPKFVTPYALKPMADCLREIYPNDEDFVNGVLTLVHQITYEEIIPAYYPTETLARGTGDCDLLSLIAASILKAGGLDVVLLHYVDEEHMNIGVHLADTPKEARLDIYSVEDGNVKYYIAECTSSNWQDGWRVGECPDDLKDTAPIVITLENSAQMTPGQVSASFKKLDSTNLSLTVSPVFALEGTLVTIQGQLSPSIPNESITLYVNSLGSPLTVISTISTESDGTFTYTWQTGSNGLLNVRASWAGNNQYAGTTSQTAVITILPLYIVGAIVAVVILAALGVAVAVWFKRNRKQTLPPPPPPTYIPQPPQQMQQATT